MPFVDVEQLVFQFDDAMNAEKYDDWAHYQEILSRAPLNYKAVDVVAIQSQDQPEVKWLIEAKDFRLAQAAHPPKPSNISGLPNYVYEKSRDTILGLQHAAANAADPKEAEFSQQSLTASSTRIVLHLEPYGGQLTTLFPRNFTASVLQRLKQIAGPIDANPLVLNMENTPRAAVPWTVNSAP